MAIGRHDEHSRGSAIGTPRDACTHPKPYVSIEELATLTPWTQQAIRSMIKRGDFVVDVHFFRIGRRILFKWNAVVDLIEHRTPPSPNPIPLQRSARRHESTQA